MEKILYDWGEMCENNSSFERGYFFTLLMEDLNKEKVYEVCRYFPNSMKLIKKMEKFLFHTFPSIENVSEKKQKLQNLLIEDSSLHGKSTSYSKLLLSPSHGIISFTIISYLEVLCFSLEIPFLKFIMQA